MNLNTVKHRKFSALIVLLLFSISGCGESESDSHDPIKNKSTFSEMTVQDALSFEVIDRRQILLSTLGPPDTFTAAIEMIDDTPVVTEQWSYFEMGVRLDIIDGEISYVLPMDTSVSEVAIYPRFYDPMDFALPMNKSEAIQLLDGQNLSDFDLTAADFSNSEMIIGDQIILGFNKDKLVYVETLAMSPDPEGELKHLYEDDGLIDTSTKPQSNTKPDILDLAPPQIQLIGNFLRLFRIHGQRNKVYREANKVQSDYRDYIARLKKKAEELAGSCRLSTLDRQSNAATLKRMNAKLDVEMQVVNYLTEAEKRNARSRFIHDARTKIIDALATSGLGARIVSKLKESAKIEESLSDLQDMVDGILDPGGFKNKITERLNKLGVLGQAVGGPLGAKLKSLVSRLQRNVPGVTAAQNAATKLQTDLEAVQDTLDKIDLAFSGDKTLLSPAYLAGNIDQLFGTLDDPTIDAIAYALAKNMEPGLARNIGVSEGALDPTAFKTMMERVRGAMLRGRTELLREKARETCGRPAGEAFMTELSANPQKPIGHALNLPSRAESSTTDEEPVSAPVCESLPVNVNEVNNDSLVSINDSSYRNGIAANDDMCLTPSTNTPPIAFSQIVTTEQDASVAITLQGFDSDKDRLFYDIVSQPSNGQLTGVAPAVNYTPAAEYSGADSFTFKADDGKSDSQTVTVSIEVTALESKQYYVFKRSGSGYRKKFGGYADSITGFDYFYLYIFPSEVAERKSAYSKFDEATQSACTNGPALCPCPPTPDIWQSGNIDLVGSYASVDELDYYKCDNAHYGPSNLICNMWETKSDPKYWQDINAICN